MVLTALLAREAVPRVLALKALLGAHGTAAGNDGVAGPLADAVTMGSVDTLMEALLSHPEVDQPVDTDAIVAALRHQARSGSGGGGGGGDATDCSESSSSSGFEAIPCESLT